MIVESLVAAFCMSAVDPTHHDACKAALVAGTIQVGVKSDVDRFETFVRKSARQHTYRLIGDSNVRTPAGIVYVYQTIKERHAVFQFSGGRFCRSITTDLTPRSYTVKFNWSF